MKWFAVCAVLLSVAVSATEAVARGADQQNDVERKLQSNNYEPWEQGTLVYYQFGDGWYWGTITDYYDGAYTTTWSDGVDEVFQDLSAVNQMVQNAEDYVGNYEPWEQGTLVYYQFDDGWYWGTITGYDDGAYTTTWSDGDDEVFEDLSVVDQMVKNADDNGGDEASQYGDGEGDQYEPWPSGTAAYYEFDDGWYQGQITGYDSDTGAYSTTWSDGENEIFTDLDAVDQMVADAANLPDPGTEGDGEGDQYDPWPSGTVVYYEFEDSWYEGRISDYEDGYYMITWTEGDIEYFEDTDLVDQMVSQAVNIPSAQDTNTDNYAPWAPGTAVRLQWEGAVSQGEVVSYVDGTYTIIWSDKEVETFDDPNVVDQMVEDARLVANASQARSADANATKKEGMSGGGTLFLVVAVFGAVGAAAIFLRRHRKQKREQKLEESVKMMSADLPHII
jgi:hypothetical protein